MTAVEQRKLAILKRMTQSPCTSHDCAAALGVTKPKIQYLISEMLRDKRLFRVGFADRRVVYSTDANQKPLPPIQQKMMDAMAEGPKTGMQLVAQLGLTVSRTFEALRMLHAIGAIYVVSKEQNIQSYAIGNLPDVVPKRRRKPPTKAERIARIQRKEEKYRQQRLVTFERQRQEGIAKNARMLPFAW